MHNSKISVIVPVYNNEGYIRTCIESVTCQTYKNIELILIDDGSTDKSGSVCDEYAQSDSRIVVLHLQNGGVSKARNTGIRVATGEWLTFIDFDDWISPNTYSDAVGMIEKFDVDFVEFGYALVDTDGTVNSDCNNALSKFEPIGKREIIENIVPQMVHTKPMNATYMRTWLWNKLFNTYIIRTKKICFDDTILLWGDGIFTIEYMQYVNSLISMEGRYYYYRNTPDSLSKTHDEKIFSYIESIYEKYRSIYSKYYDFENETAREYRFQLIHGTVLREIKGQSILLTKRILTSAFSSEKLKDYFCRYHPRNPYFGFIRAALKINSLSMTTLLYWGYVNVLQRQ